MKANNDVEAPEEAIYAPESHPVAGGIGALGGAAAGAALGAGLGPLGAVTGAVIGVACGAIAGKAIAAGIDPEAEDVYWQKQYRHEPYYESEYAYDDYGPAYRLGWQLYSPHQSFEAAEKVMSDEWAQGRGSSKLEWNQARHAAKAGWSRIGSLQVGD
ncbi:hypothetical protein JIN84_01485 [Luteolibacter yonseiensis]|uniref:Glycine zipper domain-containing protein n=1 Tax=Luteolibacter yonseiensis TaxID=1144680 RepID=A0A934V9L1_9BACT|nr:hypothetical protein [Luteolibacter yonseiensis]MBK1814280.1 hypothetical protein [Luteolibacter yonseiensis]